MSLGAFVTITRPQERGDTYRECIASAQGVCDEVVTIVGDNTWPKEFNWPIISQHFQRGYDKVSTDWVLRLDTDYILHEQDYARLRSVIGEYPDAPAISLYKYQFIQPDRYNLKSRLLLLFNKRKYGDRIKLDSGGDLCQPSLDGKELRLDDCPQSGIAFYNYEKLTKNFAQVIDDTGRMARAWSRHFKNYKLGGPDEASAYYEWLNLMLARYRKPSKEIAISDHPKVIQNTIMSLKPRYFGYNAFGNLEKNKYV